MLHYHLKSNNSIRSRVRSYSKGRKRHQNQPPKPVRAAGPQAKSQTAADPDPKATTPPVTTPQVVAPPASTTPKQSTAQTVEATVLPATASQAIPAPPPASSPQRYSEAVAEKWGGGGFFVFV